MTVPRSWVSSTRSGTSSDGSRSRPWSRVSTASWNRPWTRSNPHSRTPLALGIGSRGAAVDAADRLVAGAASGLGEAGVDAEELGQVAAADGDLLQAHAHLSRPGDRLVHVDELPVAGGAQAGGLQDPGPCAPVPTLGGL